MLYKEWKLVRVKLWFWLAFYGLSGVYFSIYGPPLSLNGYQRHFSKASPEFSYSPALYEQWAFVFLFLTALNAVLGGVDAISEEKSKRTIGFLLARPISRNYLYTSKLLVNIMGVWITGVLGCLPVWITDVTGPKPFGTVPAILTTVIVLLAGATIVCLTALISIYTRSATETYIISTVVLAIVWTVWATLKGWNFPIHSFTLIQLSIDIFKVTSVVLVLYCVGTFCFSRKQF